MTALANRMPAGHDVGLARVTATTGSFQVGGLVWQALVTALTFLVSCKAQARIPLLRMATAAIGHVGRSGLESVWLVTLVASEPLGMEMEGRECAFWDGARLCIGRGTMAALTGAGMSRLISLGMNHVA
jgi:hypothetical protein